MTNLPSGGRAVPAVSAIGALLVHLMNDRVSSLQRKGIAANFALAVLPCSKAH